jgi:glycosyltransferase involved in cell wall biosynthesis
LRIIHLTHYFLPESFGGTQAYVANLARGQIDRGHQAYVVTGSPRLDSDVASEHGVWNGIPTFRIYRQGEAEFFSGDTGSERITNDVLSFVQEVGPDLIHLHHWHALSRGLVAQLAQLGVPVVVTLHDLFTTCMRFFRMPDPRRMCAPDVGFDDCARCVSPDLPTKSLAELELFAAGRFAAFQEDLACADAVLCVSDAQNELLSSIPGFEVQLQTFPIGVPALTPRVAGTERQPGDVLKLVCWGGIEPRKGIHLLSAAIANSSHRDSMELHLHGQVSSPEYEQEIYDAGDGIQITFHGKYDDAELADFGNHYDLAVFPFIAFETYALSVDEALHLEIPLVVCDRGAPKERIDGRGLLFEAENIPSLTATLDRFHAEPKLLQQMSYASHKAVQIDTHIDQLTEFYDQLDA